jgi:DNA-binding IscR family transcriptional regulator
VNHVVQQAETTVTLQSLQRYLDVPTDAARRIASNLVNAGLVKEVRDGVWCRISICAPWVM